MNSKAASQNIGALLIGLAVFLSAPIAATAEPASGHDTALTKEQREKMAVVHEQMAACLRSDKSLADCHKEAMKSCRDAMMGKGGCPMMGHHSSHDHRMHDHASTTGEAQQP